MSYTNDDLEKLALKAIEAKKLIFITEVAVYLPCTRATFYNRGLDKLDSLKNALFKNKIEIKSAMRVKWYKSENATLQMGLYKLLGSEDERRRLSQQFHNLEGEATINQGFDLSGLKTETLIDFLENAEKGQKDEDENDIE